ncbi:MAG: nucleotidyltransferase family protein [Acidobacteria bacterium]|nr:nucleotidyltransferase family protein [Acidobacteriota bacterium]MBI3658579.1 nucleotidyltransferase family protein [Acidobacteriota bacterium]
MLTREKAVRLLQEKHPYLAAEFGVSKIGLFGSYAKGHSTDASDIDLIVEFERPIGFRFIELVDYLENLLGRKVDVLTPAGIQNIRVERVARSISQSIVYV